jgi:hypothetical protein
VPWQWDPELRIEYKTVKLVLHFSVPPYSPDLTPIEEFFAELKAFIKRNWGYYEADPDQGFDAFLAWCIDIVGAKEESAKGHFRHAGLKIEEILEGPRCSLG